MTRQTAMPEYTGTYFLGEQGERGNSQKIRGFELFPLIKCLGNRGNTNMFLNIKPHVFPDIWLSLFPTFSDGEHVPRLKAPETLAVPTVPPFPRFFFTGTFGHSCKSVEVAP
ncbi:hypothetical protein SAMN05216599_116135 [Pseudomonas cichorii]|nr:hypothetical protein SAMN05216599_116135 [Pseudomonas cichorii]